MPKTKNLILLTNIGSPNELSLKGVRRYLRSFLMDPHVIQIPFIFRFVLVYIVISYVRTPKTLKKYASIWRPEGSPLLYFSELFRSALEAATGTRVLNLMMYSEPGFDTAFKEIKKGPFENILVAPMYPHYTESSYMTSVEKIKRYLKKYRIKTPVRYLPAFYSQPLFIESFRKNILNQFPEPQKMDQVVFTYHGIPESHLHKGRFCQSTSDCTDEIGNADTLCYRAQCYRTSELIATALNLPKNSYVTCFQSRVGVNKWIEPYLDEHCRQQAANGKKNLLLISPSFVVDGLETLQEITDLETEISAENKIRLHLVQALNAEDHWVQNFSEIIKKYQAGGSSSP